VQNFHSHYAADYNQLHINYKAKHIKADDQLSLAGVCAYLIWVMIQLDSFLVQLSTNTRDSSLASAACTSSISPCPTCSVL